LGAWTSTGFTYVWSLVIAHMSIYVVLNECNGLFYSNITTFMLLYPRDAA